MLLQSHAGAEDSRALEVLVLLLGRGTPHRLAARLDLSEAELFFQAADDLFGALKVFRIGNSLTVKVDESGDEMDLLMLMFVVFNSDPHCLVQPQPGGELFRNLNFRLRRDFVFCRDADSAVKNNTLQLRVERGQRVELPPQFLGVATRHVPGNDRPSRFFLKVISRRLPF